MEKQTPVEKPDPDKAVVTKAAEKEVKKLLKTEDKKVD
jgi:hypothetical protein